jgi:asparagine synthase (glutamine-hydrolysing)
MNPRLVTEYAWGEARGPSLRGLVGAEKVRLDAAGVAAAFGEADAPGSTCIAGARWAWPTTERMPETDSWLDALTGACARAPDGRVALALSGGVDSAVLAALLRGRVTLYTLVPELPDYAEAEEAQTVADRLKLPLRRVSATAEEFVAALPAAVSACECPLYNLHPVGRLLLARAVRADGFDVLVAGDGADEVFRGTSGADYLPIVGAMTRAAGLVAHAPFLDAAVAACVPREDDKRSLRGLAMALDLPVPIAVRHKRARFAPAMDVSRYRDDRVTALAAALGRTPAWDSDRERVGWTTLAMFAREFPGLELACAG